MRRVRGRLAPKRDGGIAGIVLRPGIQRPKALLVVFRLQEHLNGHEALVGRARLHQGPVQRRMGRDQFLLDCKGDGFIKQLFEEAILGKPPHYLALAS